MKHLFIFLSLFLFACAGATPWNPQGYAGLNYAVVTWNDEGQIEKAKVIGGKEAESANVKMLLPDDSEFTFEGESLRSFSAFQTRAEVESFVAEKAAEVTPELKDALVEIISKIAGL